MSKASFEVLHQGEWVESPAEYAKYILMMIGWQNEVAEGQFHQLPNACGIKLQHPTLLEAHLRF